MNKLFSLLLLTPILALAQELPDEDWVCVTSHSQDSIILDEENTLQNQKRDLPNFMFNPSKGYRDFRDNDYVQGNCSAYGMKTEPDMYVCSTALGAISYNNFQLNTEEQTFNLVNSYAGNFGQRVTFYLGNCTKP
jgi:hypothetical protein